VNVRLLIDTNVLIPLEPTQRDDVEPGSRGAASLIRLAQEAGHTILIHPSSLVDLQRDGNPDRLAMRELLVTKYVRLDPAPSLAIVEPVLGPVAFESNDWVDHLLLAAVKADAVDVLVTQDGGIHRKAVRLGVADRVLTVDDVIALLTMLHDHMLPPPPSVDFVPMHAVASDDPIFESLRCDYEGFDEWFTRCKRQGRGGWVAEGPDHRNAAICIIKPNDDDYGLGGKVLKLCTFKVAAEHQGNRYGELLLKALFAYCHENTYDHVYVTVFERYQGLIALFEEFGFRCLEDRTSGLGELVYAKDLTYCATEMGALEALAFHVRFGPPALRLRPDHTYVVPITPRYHAILFPDAEVQAMFPMVARPYGNALRKAYLCNAPIRRLAAGDTLLFYRSQDLHAVTSVGVVEETLVSRDVDEIVAMVGQRTVYTYEEIRDLARRQVLTIMFRQDRLLVPPITVRELATHGAIRRAPQSIAAVSGGAIAWLGRRLGEPSFSPSGPALRTQSSTAPSMSS
jgi:L-amino acid N-acyltransferase YncA